LIPGLIATARCHWPRRAFFGYAVCAGLVPFAILVIDAWLRTAEWDRLRQEYAFESMEDRVRLPKKNHVGQLSEPSEEQLNRLTKHVAGESRRFRERMLQSLHDESVRSFINSPGFGVGRRILPTESNLKMELERDDGPIRQPDPILPSTLAPSDLREPRSLRKDSLRTLHLDGVFDFVNPRGFGLIENRGKVAGFQSHRFNRVPGADQWRVRTVELVGLLMHPEPVVYASDVLPRMDRLRKASTRPLNTFESTGLTELEKGDDLFVRESPQGLLMLGAVRSIEQCTKCHGGERGDLLGAFSYRLQPQP
jgi:hypothetical protein